MKKMEYMSVSILILILFIIYSDILLSPGNLVVGDLTFPIFLEKFLSLHIFTWSDSLGWNTYDLIPRLAYNLPFIVIGIIFDLDISIISKAIIFFTAILMTLSFFIFLRYILKDLKYDDNIIIYASLCSSIIYGINVWVITRIGHLYLLPTYAIIPVIIMILIKCNENRNNYIKYSLMIGILIPVFGISPHGIFWIMSIIMSWLLFISFYPRFDYRYFLYNVKFMILIILSSLIMSSYFILPMLFSSISTPTISLSPSYMMNWEVFDMLSRNSDIYNVLRLTSDWWPQGNYSPDQSHIYSIWYIISFMLPLIAFISIIYNRNRYTIYFSILALLFILLSLGTKTDISKSFYDLFTSFLGQFVWIFRDPAKNLSILALSYSILVGISISEILKRINIKLIIYIVIIFLVLYGFFIMPTVVSYMFGVYTPSKIPTEYLDTNRLIGNDSGDFKVLWLSSWNYGKRINGTTRYSWANNKSTSSQMTVGSSEKPSFDKGRIDNFKYYSIYLDHIISDNVDIKKYLSPLSIKYVIYVNDGFGGEYKGSQDIQILKRYFDNITNYGFIHIFENQQFSPYINIVSNIIVSGGLDKSTSLYNIDSFNSTNLSLLFLDQINSKYKYIYVKNADYLIVNNIDDLSLTFNDDNIIKPLDATIHYDPYKLWSRASITDPLHGEFHPYLDKFGIENWDFDYGKGLIFSKVVNKYKPIKLNMDIVVNSDDDYELFVRYFKNSKGGRIKISLDGKIINIVDTNDQLNKFEWNKVGTLKLKKGEYRLTLTNVEGFNAVNIFVLIPKKEYEILQKKIYTLLEGKRLIYIFEAESDIYRNNVTISKKANASNGEVTKFKKASVIWQNVSILRDDNYMIALKLSGTINIQIDQEKYNISSNTTDFKYIGPIYLNKRNHRITISSNVNDSDLDTIWIYSTNDKGETIEDIFMTNEAPAKVINYSKIDPTLYKIQINASKPFMMSFAESYNPLWVVNVNKINEKEIKSDAIHSVPLYSVINGFWINQTGNLEITIQYEPQKWFIIGLIISSISFISCIMYLLYNKKRIIET